MKTRVLSVDPNSSRTGQIHHGTQNHQCRTCGRQFVVDATNRLIGTGTAHGSGPVAICEKISPTRYLPRAGRRPGWLWTSWLPTLRQCLLLSIYNLVVF